MRKIIALALAASLGGCAGIKIYGPGEPIEGSPPAFDVSKMPYEPVDYTSIPPGHTGYVYNSFDTHPGGLRFKRGGIRFGESSIHAEPPAFSFSPPAIRHSPGGAFDFRR